MSDRRPSKPEDGYATQLDNLAALMGTNKSIRETAGTIVADSVSAALLGYADLLRDPVAVVRRGVESGTIEGAKVWNCSGFGGLICEPSSDASKRNHPNCGYRLVIPVSDGGSET